MDGAVGGWGDGGMGHCVTANGGPVCYRLWVNMHACSGTSYLVPTAQVVKNRRKK